MIFEGLVESVFMGEVRQAGCTGSGQAKAK